MQISSESASSGLITSLTYPARSGPRVPCLVPAPLDPRVDLDLVSFLWEAWAGDETRFAGCPSGYPAKFNVFN